MNGSFEFHGIASEERGTDYHPQIGRRSETASWLLSYAMGVMTDD
jgi:hypothetical protein